MYYYDTNFKSPKRWATIALSLYALLLGLSFLFVSFDFGRETDSIEGILIDFGTTQDGQGEHDVRATEEVSTPEPVVSAKAAEFNTVEESDIVVQQVKVKDKPKAEPVKEVPRKADPRALFPGRTVGSQSKSEGATKGAGNAGDLSGAPQGSHEGRGQSDEGLDYDLTGRSIIGSLPKPPYSGDASGKVVVAVTVDSNGKVMTASYKPQGSTTSNEILVKAAQEAALKARFTDSGRHVQAGTITYIFRMN